MDVGVSSSKWMAMDEEMAGIRTTTLTITPELLGLISQIDEFKGARSPDLAAPRRDH